MSALTLLGALNCLLVGFIVGFGWFTAQWLVSRIFK